MGLLLVPPSLTVSVFLQVLTQDPYFLPLFSPVNVHGKWYLPRSHLANQWIKSDQGFCVGINFGKLG